MEKGLIQDTSLSFASDFYWTHLQTINEIRFSRREVDVIACILKARTTKKIAGILSISPKTVFTHVRNVMLKLDVNSRDGIIDFFEKSDKYKLLQQHYVALLTNNAFVTCLKKIKRELKENPPSCTVIYSQDDKDSFLLATHVCNAMKLAGVEVQLDTSSESFSRAKLIKEAQQKKKHVICLFPSANDLSSLVKEVDTASLLLVLHESQAKDLSPVQGLNVYVFNEQHASYMFILCALEKLLPSDNVQKSVDAFTSHIQNFQDLKEPSFEVNSLKNNKNDIFLSLHNTKAVLVSSLLFFCCIVFASYFTPRWFSIQPSELQSGERAHIQSDLTIPPPSAFLSRPALMKSIDAALNCTIGIRTIALLGGGGSGKTTLARQYAHQQSASVIWEMNAETEETLQLSFENLAQALSKTRLDQEQLKKILANQSLPLKKSRTLTFVRQRLKALPNWILIFDNVEEPTTIKEYFPNSVNSWGKGKVLITTRNTHIETHNHVDGSIFVPPLTFKEKTDLFLKITSLKDQIGIKEFLEELPAFPLDVIAAAYYIKATGIPLDEYLKNLKQQNLEFLNLHEDILKNAASYDKTRYKITQLSLEHIIHDQKDFPELLLLISLLNPQNIPISLLNSFKDSVSVSRLVYNLKKQSLISENSPHAKAKSSEISLHRSTHQMVGLYVQNLLNIKKGDEHIQSIAKTIDNYMGKLIEEDDIPKMKQLIPHIEYFLRHHALLEPRQKMDLMAKLGFFYIYFGEYNKSKDLLEKSLITAQKFYGSDHIKTAWILRALGLCNKHCGQYHIARNFLEKSLEVYKKHLKQNHHEITETSLYLGNMYASLGKYNEARILLEKSLANVERAEKRNTMHIATAKVHLGALYKRVGNYKDSVKMLEEALHAYESQSMNTDAYKAWTMVLLGSAYTNLGFYDKGLKTCLTGTEAIKRHYSDEHKEYGISLVHLGNTYRRLGDYKKALTLLKRANMIYKNHYGESHLETAWTDIHLGNIYRLLKDLGKAKHLIEHGLHVYKTNFGKDHINTGWAYIYLGNFYKDQGNFIQAENLLKKGLEVYTNYYGTYHTDLAWVYRALGEIFLEEGKFTESEQALEKALTINRKTQNPEIIFTLESLIKLKQNEAKQALKSGDSERAKLMKKKAKLYQTQAIEAAKKYFPKESPHISKLKEFR